MLMALKKKKNLIRSPDEYTRYYGDFRGVDFSSDHTEVHDQRLAYAINMYKDYRTGEGNAIETIPGYRRRFQAPRSNPDSSGNVVIDRINGIHEFVYIGADGKRDKDILIHAGKYLYRWDNYPYSVNVLHQQSNTIPITEDGKAPPTYYEIALEGECSVVESIIIMTDGTPTDKSYYTYKDGILKLASAYYGMYEGRTIHINYYEQTLTHKDAICEAMSDNESKSFTFNDRLYLLDGTDLYVYYKSGTSFVIEKVYGSTSVYVPTTYRNIGVGVAAPEVPENLEIEQKNLLSPYYRHSYIADGETQEYPLYALDDVASVYVNGEPLAPSGYAVVDGVIKFTAVPEKAKPENAAGVIITYRKSDKEAKEHSDRINKCTIVATFDKRVFLTGNPEYPNHIWYCSYNNNDGREDATYFGQIDYVVDGVENAPITGLIPVADTLAALKNHARQDGSIYFHRRQETSQSTIPVTYPSEQGLSGIGCLGACVNFLDDPIFISRLGVEAIGQLSVRLERAVEHRSSLIDAKLVNLDLNEARFAEWDGYLLVLVDGKIFLADSRQRYTHETGVTQYEWYYLEDIGIWEDQYPEYYYASAKYSYLPETLLYRGEEYEIDLATHIFNPETLAKDDLTNTAVKPDETISIDLGEDTLKPHVFSKSFTVFDDDGNPYEYIAYFTLKDTWDGESYSNGTRVINRKAILCEDFGSFTGGTFYKATKIVTIEENVADNTTASTSDMLTANIASNVFFGTDNGIVCSFNFDMKYKDGTISPKWYTFDERTIYSGIATKMDNCGIPHLTKSTIKKSTVLKTKAMLKSVVKVKIRTNDKGYEGIARVNSRVFSFDDVDFTDFSFVTNDQTIFPIKEKEKHWVEKQHWIYSDEFRSPLSVHYLAFRYKISGRIKG